MAKRGRRSGVCLSPQGRYGLLRGRSGSTHPSL
jgi:hypothetical protein